MKQKFSPFLIFLFALGILAGFTAHAQEVDPVNNDEKEIKEELSSHPELNLNEDKTLIVEPEQKSTLNHPVSKETTPSAKTTKPKSNPEKDEDEDALSFNFLYYIIQKFKYSDIVDN
jgi:hypothetical protein